MHYSGGFLRTRLELVRDKRFDGDHELIPSPATLEALDRMQSVPLCVNHFVADVLERASLNGDQLGGLPPVALPVPERDPAEWRRKTRSQRNAWNKDRDATIARNAKHDKERGNVARIERVLAVLRDEPELYHVYTLEWRGRYLPAAPDLAYTQGDLSRGLLRFRDEQPLTAEGERGLRIGIANAFGQDKISFDDRLLWAEQNMRYLLDSAESPFDGERFWCTADEPWLALALCHDLHRGRTATAVWTDATASGCQHLAGLSRCAVTAAQVNLLPGPRQDIYSAVAKVFDPQKMSLLALSSTYAAHWREAMADPKVARKICKAIIMPVPYGATRRGHVKALQPFAEAAGIPKRERGKACNWMAEQLEEAMDDLLPGPMFVLEHLKQMAATICKAGRDVTWTAPNGNVIRQRYLKLVTKRQQTHSLGRVNYIEADETEVDIGAGIRGLVPQYVHSLDASHITTLVNRWNRDVVTVHDAVGTNANDMKELHRLAIAVLAEMYQSNPLQALYTEQRERHPDLAAQFVMPPMGKLNPALMFQSEYAFS